MSSVMTVTFLLFTVVILTRFMPFWFQKALKNNYHLERVGRQLPAFIMTLLLIFELNPKSFLVYPYGAPAFIALAVLSLFHLWKRQVLLSMLTGLVTYLFVLPYFH